MIYAIQGNRPEDTKWSVAQAFYNWCIAQGLECKLVSSPSCVKNQESTVLVWGWMVGKQLDAAGHRVIVMERGYIGDRMNTWTSLGLSGLNGRAKWHIPPGAGGERFSMFHEHLYKPWNPDGDYILIIGQVPGDQSLEGRDPISWASTVAVQAKQIGLPIYYRPHPNVIARGDKRVPMNTKLAPELPLDEVLKGAALVITYSSTVAVESLIAGKPTIAQHPCSMAYNIAQREIEVKNYKTEPKDRRKWAEMLAWKQWTLSEIEAGHHFFWLLDK